MKCVRMPLGFRQNSLKPNKKTIIAISCMILLYMISVGIYRAGFSQHHHQQQHLNDLIELYVPNGPHDRENSNRIVFHESSGRRQLNSRQCCAVEAAARNNPDRPVQLFMLSVPGFDRQSAWLRVLSHYSNVRVILINEGDYFKSTPLESWFVKGEWRRSPYKKIHLSDYLRMLTLFKGGGLYLDLDILVLKRLEQLENFFAVEEQTPTLICNSVLHLEKSHRFMSLIIEYLKADYRPHEWGYHGGEIITAIMHYYCNFREKQLPINNDCDDVKLFNYTSFFPVVPEAYDVMFHAATQKSFELFNQSYGVHIWNSKSHNDFLDFRSNQLYSHIARQHCPLTTAKASLLMCHR